MADQKDKNKGKYTVEEILAEYGGGRRKSENKVVEFPQPEEEQEEEESRTQEEAPPAGGGEIYDISPDGLGDRLAAKMSGLMGRMDYYADHMYDQAEPDEATRRLERYVPGVDAEEEPERPVRVWRAPTGKTVPADTAPQELVRKYKAGMGLRRVRVFFALVFSLLCALASLDIWTGVLPPVMGTLTLRQWQLWGSVGLLWATALLCVDVLAEGLGRLLTLRPRLESLTALAVLFTLGDGVCLAMGYGRDGLSYSAAAAFSAAFTLWGNFLHRRGDWLSARVAGQVKEPYRVTLDEKAWSGRPVYAKWPGSAAGFGSQLQMEDPAQRAYGAAAPLLMLCCLTCGGLSWAAGGWEQALWTTSATFTAAAAWSGALVYALPYKKLAQRLAGEGAAMAGWPGVGRCRTEGLIIGDGELFPPGTVRVSNIRLFGSFSGEQVVAYTATLLRALDCGLGKPFHDLVRAQGAFYREVSQLQPQEGGVSGYIRNKEVLVGSADFMGLMEVALPQGMNVKHAVFCAINGELAGIFALQYNMGQSVKPCLSALMSNGVSPVLATRDPNLIPAFLGQKFKLPVERMEYPPVERRMELSSPMAEHDMTPVALLSREGLGPYCDAVVGGCRLRKAALLGIAANLLGTVLGVALTFYMSYAGAVGSMTAAAFLVFMGLWLVPTLLLSSWADRY